MICHVPPASSERHIRAAWSPHEVTCSPTNLHLEPCVPTATTTPAVVPATARRESVSPAAAAGNATIRQLKAPSSERATRGTEPSVPTATRRSPTSVTSLNPREAGNVSRLREPAGRSIPRRLRRAAPRRPAMRRLTVMGQRTPRAARTSWRWPAAARASGLGRWGNTLQRRGQVPPATRAFGAPTSSTGVSHRRGW